MDVKLVTGSISLGQQKSMDDIIADVTGKREVKTASQDVEVKTAEEKECETCGKCPCECDEEEKDCEAAATEEVKKAEVAAATEEVKKAEVDEAAEELEEEEDAAAGDEEEKESDAKEEVKEATQKPQFVKIAKMTPEARNFLREYWATIYPAEYVEAILAEK